MTRSLPSPRATSAVAAAARVAVIPGFADPAPHEDLTIKKQ